MDEDRKITRGRKAGLIIMLAIMVLALALEIVQSNGGDYKPPPHALPANDSIDQPIEICRNSSFTV